MRKPTGKPARPAFRKEGLPVVPTRFIPRCTEAGPSLAGQPDWMSSLLRARGIDTEEKARRFLSPSLAELYDPFLLDGMKKTVDLLSRAIEQKQTILVYGDYDVDGICATSILLEALHEKGASLAYRIPSRHTEGYGLNTGAVQRLAYGYSAIAVSVCFQDADHFNAGLQQRTSFAIVGQQRVQADFQPRTGEAGIRHVEAFFLIITMTAVYCRAFL